MRKCLNSLVFSTFFLLLATIDTVGADSPTPQEVVESFQETMISVMKDAEQLTVKDRYDRLAPAVESAFHGPLIVRIVAGAHWASASAEQRQGLVDAFHRMSLATLATLFDGYGGQVFKTVSVDPGPQNTVLVRTRLIDPDDTYVDIAYATLAIQGRPWVIDVILDNGISELTVRRSEYNKTLQDGGVDALIELLNGKADQLLNGKAS